MLYAIASWIGLAYVVACVVSYALFAGGHIYAAIRYWITRDPKERAGLHHAIAMCFMGLAFCWLLPSMMLASLTRQFLDRRSPPPDRQPSERGYAPKPKNFK